MQNVNNDGKKGQFKLRSTATDSSDCTFAGIMLYFLIKEDNDLKLSFQRFGMMNKHMNYVPLLCCLLLGVLHTAQAGAVERSGTASLDIMSDYVWRGINRGNDGVIQPSVGIIYDNLGLKFWSNYDMDTHEGNETDVTLNYTLPGENGALEIGYIFYSRDGTRDTQELYAAISANTVLSPALTVYVDFDEGDGAFADASILHSIKIQENIDLSLAASVGMSIENEVMDNDGGFTNLYRCALSASLGFKIHPDISVEPKIAYSFALSDEAEDAIRTLSVDGDDSVFYSGLNITLDF